MRADSSPEPASPEFAPVRIVEVEASADLPRLETSLAESGRPYGAALCLVRLHGQPLGLVEAKLPAEGLAPAALRERIETVLGEAIEAHLHADGLDCRAAVATGDQEPGRHRCNAAVDSFLARAPQVSVVIPTRDRPQLAAEAVASVLESRYPPERLEVILVDNRPTAEIESDGAFDAGGSLADERVRILHEPISGGANARNTGLAHAKGEIVAFTDDDVIVDRDWLATIVRAFDGQPNVGAASGLVMPRELETPAQVWFEGYARFSGRFERHAYDLGPNRPQDDPLFPFDVGILGTGANMAFRTDVLREAGELDPAFNTSALPNGTDVEVLLRVLLRGWTVVRNPAAIVHHAHQREYRQFERRVYGYGLGLTAVLTKTLIHNPRLIPLLLAKLPRGLAFALSSGSAKHEAKPSDFPPELNRLELRGMLHGPLAYARGRRETKRRAKQGTSGVPVGGLRVLLVTDSYPPLVGGATLWSQQVARRMSERGHTVSVATSWQPGTPARERDGEVEVQRLRDLTSRMRWISDDPYRHNPPPFPDPEAIVRLRRLICDFKPDLVHSYGWLTHSVAAALLGTDIPLLVSTQDYSNVCALRTLFRHGEICDGPAPAKCLECAASHYGAAKGSVAVAGIFGSWPLLRRKVTRIHSISRYVANVIERDLKPSAPIEIIPNFSEEEDAEADDSVLAELPAEPFILFVGALREVKGIAELCAAYERLDDPPPLVLVGPPAPDTWDRFPPGVSVLTSVPHATVMAMWDRALFGVFPSKWPEPLGNVVYEAMSRGRAVIGTRPGGHEDMIDDEETGLLVPAGDVNSLCKAMSRLLSDAELRTAIGARARTRAQAFTAEAILPELDRLYRETAGTPAGERRSQARI
jgi:glycosyltransferase involved in cell wall biosynthesis/GT2 family glycosyltransferase